MAPLLPTSSSFLRLQGERRGAAGGLLFAGRRIPWGELAAAADDLAGWLARRGVGAGQHVGVTAANEPALVAMLYALWGLGAVAVPIGVRATAAETARLLAHARASGLFADSPRAEVARDAAAAVGLPAWVCRPELPLAPRLLRRVLAGSGAVLFERFELGTVLEAVERHGITDLPLIGGMVFDVVQAGSVPAAVRQTVRKVSVGGAPTPMEAKRALAEIFAGAEIIEAYGQTEATDGVTMARAGSGFVREGTGGRVHPDVAEVAVIGTPHPRWGEQVTAVVVPRPGAAPDAAALAAFAGARLAGFKKPRRIEFVAALPRNAAKKVETGLLRQQFGG